MCVNAMLGRFYDGISSECSTTNQGIDDYGNDKRNDCPLGMIHDVLFKFECDERQERGNNLRQEFL